MGMNWEDLERTMCFEYDSDWTASIVEDKTTIVTKPVKCDECGRVIQPGEFVRHVYQQEHEVCRHDPESDDFDGPEWDENDEPIKREGCLDGCNHDYGETFDWDCCEACNQLIEGIHRHELDEGCHEADSRPALGELYETVAEGNGKAYLDKAEELFPGITGRLSENIRWAALRQNHDE
jgi:hypothetical protein